MNKINFSIRIPAMLLVALCLMLSTSCGAGSLAGLANQIANSTDDDGTPDQGRGDFGGDDSDDNGGDRDDREGDDDDSGSGGDDD